MLLPDRLSTSQVQTPGPPHVWRFDPHAGLLEEFLDRSGRVSRDPEPSNIRELANNAVDRIASAAEFQSVEIVQDLPEGLEIAVDQHRIRRVLANLLVNALEAMPNGGTIRISAISEPGAVLTRVCDSDPGIAPEIRDRPFQPFATAGKRKGIGLGIALSRQTVIDTVARCGLSRRQAAVVFSSACLRLGYAAAHCDDVPSLKTRRKYRGKAVTS